MVDHNKELYSSGSGRIRYCTVHFLVPFLCVNFSFGCV